MLCSHIRIVRIQGEFSRMRCPSAPVTPVSENRRPPASHLIVTGGGVPGPPAFRGSAARRGVQFGQSGYVFATGGDCFSAVFSTATDAVTAQQLLAEAAIPFEVRMGLHTGEAKERRGNYFGTDVNRAARLMSLAHGGQVVVSDTTEVLLRQRVALRPLGERLTRRLARSGRKSSRSPERCSI